MKILIGVVLGLGCLLLVPEIQRRMMPIFEKTLIRFIRIFFKKYQFHRLHLSLLGSISFMTLIFAMIPVFHWAIGIICILISCMMLWIVPRWEWAREWMQEIFFGDLNIFDETSPFSPILTIFKWPLFALGIWIIVPWGVVIVDVLGIILLILEILKRLGEANKKNIKKEQEMSEDVDIGVSCRYRR